MSNTLNWIRERIPEAAEWQHELVSNVIDSLYDDLAQAKGSNDRLRAENEALKADAERYRWLKMQSHVTWAPPGRAFTEGAGGDHLDAAIDALREGE